VERSAVSFRFSHTLKALFSEGLLAEEEFQRLIRLPGNVDLSDGEGNCIENRTQRGFAPRGSPGLRFPRSIPGSNGSQYSRLGLC